MTSGSSAGLSHGECDARFASVRQVFEENFSTRGEFGASLAIHLDGEPVLDLWGGQKDANAEWDHDTVSVVFSCTKAAVSMCAHLLIDRGALALDAPMAKYWPEFAQAGKEACTVRMALDHAAGVPAFRDPIPTGGFFDWDETVRRLEVEPPFWAPGTRNGYHMITFGWVVGELVRRVSGRPLGQFFRDEIAEPLGADFHIGLPESIEARVSPIRFPPRESTPPTDFTNALLESRTSLPALAWLNTGGYLDAVDSRAAHAAQIGGAGGVANARALAGMFAPWSTRGRHRGQPFVHEDTVDRLTTTSVATHRDATLLLPTRFSLGFMKSMDNRHREFGAIESVIVGRHAFGHVGAGGSIGFADPECGLSFGYTMNQMGHGILLNARGQRLVDAAYRALGYRSNQSGAWVR
ncbi:MAG: serine hydrolase domain-containing protein [Pseudomonadota bacterium]